MPSHLVTCFNSNSESVPFSGYGSYSSKIHSVYNKAKLHPDVLNNYCPISNLTYRSKLGERAVTAQLRNYLTLNNLLESCQSAYHPLHSTETAIVSILDDLLVALDDHQLVLLSLLDCSTAFDLVSHQILLRHPEHHLGISGMALEQFTSHLGPCASAYLERSHPLCPSHAVSPGCQSLLRGMHH